jgi:ankyrin repeat protein
MGRRGATYIHGGQGARPAWSINPTCCGAGFVAILVGALMMSNPPEPTSDLEVQLSTAMQNCLERKEHVVGVPGQPCVPADAVALLEKGVDPNTLTHVRTHTFGYYLMHLAAGSAFEHSETLLAALIEAGGDVNIVATKGDRRTPLYVAAVNGQVSKARMLLEAGAVVDKGDKLLTSPLFIAAQDGHVPMVELLLQHGAEARKPTKEGWYALNVAASECLELRNDRKVCEHGAPGERLCKHLHPIEVGVAAFAKVVQMLLEAGADPLQQDVEGSPALHYAVWCDSPDMIRSLLRHGADVNKPSLTGEPPLWVAAKRGDMEMVELFLSEVRNATLFFTFLMRNDGLPRQTRDKHKGNLNARDAFHTGRGPHPADAHQSG